MDTINLSAAIDDQTAESASHRVPQLLLARTGRTHSLPSNESENPAQLPPIEVPRHPYVQPTQLPSQNVSISETSSEQSTVLSSQVSTAVGSPTTAASSAMDLPKVEVLAGVDTNHKNNKNEKSTNMWDEIQSQLCEENRGLKENFKRSND